MVVLVRLAQVDSSRLKELLHPVKPVPKTPSRTPALLAVRHARAPTLAVEDHPVQTRASLNLVLPVNTSTTTNVLLVLAVHSPPTVPLHPVKHAQPTPTLIPALQNAHPAQPATPVDEALPVNNHVPRPHVTPVHTFVPNRNHVPPVPEVNTPLVPRVRHLVIPVRLVHFRKGVQRDVHLVKMVRSHHPREVRVVHRVNMVKRRIRGIQCVYRLPRGV
jgi:hypothetical protein